MARTHRDFRFLSFGASGTKAAARILYGPERNRHLGIDHGRPPPGDRVASPSTQTTSTIRCRLELNPVASTSTVA
jgi:hypothetical protein